MRPGHLPLRKPGFHRHPLFDLRHQIRSERQISGSTPGRSARLANHPAHGGNLFHRPEPVHGIRGNMDFSSSREGERKATLIMIAESPILGNGFDVEQSEKAKAVSGLGSHNGYLDIMKMIGIPYSVFLFAFMAYYTCSVWRKFHKSACDYDRIHLFVIISVLIAANFESYLWGINQVVTTLLFTSFAVLQKRMTDLKHGI